jgi:hypothetical protein
MLIFLLVVLPQVTKPLLVDEIGFIKAAEGIRENGIPAFNQDGRTVYFLPHPPLFVYLLGTALKLGLGLENVRLLPLVFVLMTMALVYVMARVVSRRPEIAFLSMGLYAINPLVVQSSLLIDIDNSVLTFLSTFLVYFFLRFQGNMDLKRTVILGVFLGITLWAKFTTPMLFILSIFLFHGIRGRYKMSFLSTGAMALIGSFLFLVTWWIYAQEYALPFFQPFEHNLRYLSNRLGLASYLLVGVLYAGLKIHVFWMTPAFFLLLAMSVRWRVRDYLKTRVLRKLDFLLIYSFLVFSFYMIVGQSPWKFPKYITPAMPLFAIITSEYIIRSEFKFKKNYIPALAISIAYHLLFLRDPLIPPHTAYEAAILSLLYIIPLILVFFFLLIFEKSKSKSHLLLTAVLVFIPTSLYLDAVHLTVDYSTIYNYGEGGFREAINYLRAHTTKYDVIVAPLDVGYYSRLRFYEPKAEMNIPDCQTFFESSVIKYVVLRGDWGQKYHYNLFKCLKENYSEVNFGNFYIYKVD